MLANLATLKTRLGIIDQQYDALLTDVLEQLHARFDKECRRSFGRAVDDTWEFGGDEREIFPARYPIQAVTKFEVKSSEAGGWVEVANVGCVIRRSCVISLSSRLSGAGSDVGRITYTGGYTLVTPPATLPAGEVEVPADLEQATIEQAASWFSNKERVGLVRHWPNAGTYVVLNQAPLLALVSSTL